MYKAIKETVDVAKTTDLVVSGDGTWQHRGFSSNHGAAALVATCPAPKIVEIETRSKTCNVCAGNFLRSFKSFSHK
jgi:hypothetical protein